MAKASRPFVIIGTPGDRRITLFQEALTGLDLPSASVIAYADLLENCVDLDSVIPRDAIVRIESPGKDWAVNRALALRGKEMRAPHLMVFDFPSLEIAGEYVPSWAWYNGFCACLNQLDVLQARSDLIWMQETSDIRVMFNKFKAHRLFIKNDVPSPSHQDYMASYSVNRNVFLKSYFGSSGTGMFAVQTSMQRNIQRYKIYSTMVLQNDVLINTRRLSQFHIEADINSYLLDHPQFGPLLKRWADYEQQLLSQPWIPKATVSGGAFDLRIVMIAGRMRHIVVRVSQSPITNLHLLNKRGDFDEVRRRLSDSAWKRIEETCEQVAALFPKSLYMGIDLLITPTWNKHYVLEVNAFGDLLPNLLHEGEDTYTAEIREILKKA